MTHIFDVDGDNLDPGFVNIRAQQYPAERVMHERIEAMWETYEPYADPDFRHGCAFRGNPATYSDSIRPPVPI